MSDAIDRAAEVIAPIIANATACGYDPKGTCGTCRADSALTAKALNAAGLLVSPERDAAVAAKALREAANEVYGDELAAGQHWHPLSAVSWIRDRAARIEGEPVGPRKGD